MSARHALSGLQLYRLLDRCLPAFGLDRQYRAIDVIKDFLSGVAHEKSLDASASHRTHDLVINALALHEPGHHICRITLDQMGVRLVQTKVPGQFLQVLFFIVRISFSMAIMSMATSVRAKPLAISYTPKTPTLALMDLASSMVFFSAASSPALSSAITVFS